MVMEGRSSGVVVADGREIAVPVPVAEAALLLDDLVRFRNDLSRRSIGIAFRAYVMRQSRAGHFLQISLWIFVIE